MDRQMRRLVRPTIISAPILLLATAFTAAANAYDNSYPITAYQHARAMNFEGAPSEVCPLFEPEWRKLWIGWWKPTVLYKPANGQMPGTLLRVPVPISPAHPQAERMALVVSIHDYVAAPQNWHIRYSIFYNEVEVQRVEVECTGKSGGGTAANYEVYTIGLNEGGNEAVRQYVEGGNVEHGMTAYEKSIREYLAGEWEAPAFKLHDESGEEER